MEKRKKDWEGKKAAAEKGQSSVSSYSSPLYLLPDKLFLNTKCNGFFFDFVNASHTHEKVVAKPGTTAEHCPIALIT